MPASPPRVVVFDLDGTLVHSAPDLHATVNRLLAEMRLAPLGLDVVTSFIGDGIPPLIERCLAAAGRPATGAALEAAIARYKLLYAAAPAALTRPYPGVAACLDALSARQLRLAVCTNKAEALARQVVAATGLAPHLPIIVGGDRLAVRKPDPAPLRLAAELAGAAGAHEAVFVGDSEIDAAAAHAAGMPFLLYTRGYRKAPIEALAPAASFDAFELLPALIPHG